MPLGCATGWDTCRCLPMASGQCVCIGTQDAALAAQVTDRSGAITTCLRRCQALWRNTGTPWYCLRGRGGSGLTNPPTPPPASSDAASTTATLTDSKSSRHRAGIWQCSQLLQLQCRSWAAAHTQQSRPARPPRRHRPVPKPALSMKFCVLQFWRSLRVLYWSMKCFSRATKSCMASAGCAAKHTL